MMKNIEQFAGNQYTLFATVLSSKNMIRLRTITALLLLQKQRTLVEPRTKTQTPRNQPKLNSLNFSPILFRDLLDSITNTKTSTDLFPPLLIFMLPYGLTILLTITSHYNDL